MTKKEAIKIFEEKKVRTVWNDETEEWFFSIVDVVSILTESVDGRKYWNKLKQRLKAEGSELVTNCHQLTTFYRRGILQNRRGYDRTAVPAYPIHPVP